MSQSAVDEMLVQAIEAFREKFRSNPEVAVFAPGRANLIGGKKYTIMLIDEKR